MRANEPIVLCVGFSLPRQVSRIEGVTRDPFRAEIADSQAQAVAMMFELSPTVVLIDLGLEDGSPLAVADFASYRHPDARVIFLNGAGMFADGSIFAHAPNAHAHIPMGMSEPDVMALVAHHATVGRRPN
ncbi:MAG: hypothetical protein AAFY65_17260 [Pseudomonadota bacterium]